MEEKQDERDTISLILKKPRGESKFRSNSQLQKNPNQPAGAFYIEVRVPYLMINLLVANSPFTLKVYWYIPAAYSATFKV